MTSHEWSSTTVTTSSADAGTLSFDVFGEPGGPDRQTVLALHGFPQSAHSYREVAGQLRDRGIDLIAFDQRGYSPGAQPDGVDHYADRLLAQDVIDVMDALQLSSVHLVGHDWGAQIAWLVTEGNPERIQSLTAVSVPHPAAFAEAFATDPDQRRRSGYFTLFRQEGVAERELLADNAAAFRSLFGGLPAELIDYYAERMQRPGALTAALNWYRAMSRSSASLPAVTVPTTHVWSDADNALGQTGARLTEAYVDADYRLVVLEGISHWIPEEAPSALVEAITDRVNRS